MARSKPKAKEPMSAYVDPPKILVPCQHCGLTVRRGQWQDALVEIQANQTTGEEEAVLVRTAGVKLFHPPRNPLTDDDHECAVALIQNASHWQNTVRLAEPRRFP